VEEQEFWLRLEFRICAEFAGFADCQVADEHAVRSGDPSASSLRFLFAKSFVRMSEIRQLLPGQRGRPDGG
jgi:hypothetical protein